MSNPTHIYALLYHRNTDNEGIYTIDSGGEHTVVSFENTTEAHQYASL